MHSHRPECDSNNNNNNHNNNNNNNIHEKTVDIRSI